MAAVNPKAGADAIGIGKVELPTRCCFKSIRRTSAPGIFVFHIELPIRAAQKRRNPILNKPGNTGIRRILRATIYSAQGFGHAWKHEAAFRQELALTVVLTPAALWLGQTVLERAALVGVLFVVLIVEFLNSAIEAAIDRHGNEEHELSGRAKDLGSAAVFMSLMLTLLVWSSVAYQRFFT
jgi:diacylglycerol kinase (ATP)